MPLSTEPISFSLLLADTAGNEEGGDPTALTIATAETPTPDAAILPRATASRDRNILGQLHTAHRWRTSRESHVASLSPNVAQVAPPPRVGSSNEECGGPVRRAIDRDEPVRTMPDMLPFLSLPAIVDNRVLPPPVEDRAPPHGTYDASTITERPVTAVPLQLANTDSADIAPVPMVNTQPSSTLGLWSHVDAAGTNMRVPSLTREVAITPSLSTTPAPSGKTTADAITPSPLFVPKSVIAEHMSSRRPYETSSALASTTVNETHASASTPPLPAPIATIPLPAHAWPANTPDQMLLASIPTPVAALPHAFGTDRPLLVAPIFVQATKGDPAPISHAFPSTLPKFNTAAPGTTERGQETAATRPPMSVDLADRPGLLPDFTAAVVGAAPPAVSVPPAPQAATVTGHIATPLHDPHWPHEMAALTVRFCEHIDNRDGPAETRALVTIYPAELGPVDIVIAMTNDSVDIRFAAASGETRQTLEQTLPLLGERLHAEGLALGNVEVSHRHHSQESPYPPAPYSTQQGKPAEDEAVIEQSGPVSRRLPHAHNGRIDIYA